MNGHADEIRAHGTCRRPPLEVLYPRRCYDCLRPSSDFLCASCKGGKS